MSGKDSDCDYDPKPKHEYIPRINPLTEKRRLKRLNYLLNQAGEYSSFINEKLNKDESFSENISPSSKISKVASATTIGNVVYVKETPAYITNATLRSYQIDALNWMLHLYDNGISGILADEMGLGKTIQTISLLGYLKNYRNNSGQYLIVVPLSTLNNWKIELNRFCPSLKVTVLHGKLKDRKKYISKEYKKTKWDVCLTTYDIVVIEKFLLMKTDWTYIVLDEAHKIKNEKTKIADVLRTIKSKYRLLLTGTPLQNTLHELWALLNYLLPDFFSNSADFDAWFNIDSLSKDTTARDKLHTILKPFLLRRLKSEVEQKLKPKVEIQLYTGITPMQREWYKRFLLKDKTIMKTELVRLSLDGLIVHLRQVTMHPYMFTGAEKGPPYTAGSHIVENSGKMIVLDKLLQKLKAQGSRVLIFSQMIRMLDILEDYCDWKNYTFCRFDGTYESNERQKQVEEFNEPNSDKFIFLLSTRAGGLGINLASADVVIFYDSDWNPQVDLQAMDRVHRIGQKKEVRVFRLVTENTVDERIMEIARSKLHLDHVVIQSALTKVEKLSIINHGAVDIFSLKTSDGLNDDIDTILEKGKKKTQEQTERLKKLKSEPILKTEKVSLTIFEGENYVKKRKILKEAVDNELILTTKRRRYNVKT